MWCPGCSSVLLPASVCFSSAFEVFREQATQLPYPLKSTKLPSFVSYPLRRASLLRRSPSTRSCWPSRSFPQLSLPRSFMSSVSYSLRCRLLTAAASAFHGDGLWYPCRCAREIASSSLVPRCGRPASRRCSVSEALSKPPLAVFRALLLGAVRSISRYYLTIGRCPSLLRPSGGPQSRHMQCCAC